MSGHEKGLAGLLVQFLDWVEARPRSYAETMDAWRTSCPRLSVWEDAIADDLVVLEPAIAVRQGALQVRLTLRGVAHLAAARDVMA